MAPEELEARLRAIELLLEHMLSRETPEYLRRWQDEAVLLAQHDVPDSPLLRHIERLLEAAIRTQAAREKRGLPPQGPMRD